jgi:hypothetical protein
MPISFFICLYFINLVGVIGIVRYKHLITPLRYIEWYIIYNVVSGWIEHILGSYYQIHNLWLFHFNSFIELLILLLALYSWRTSERNGDFIRWSFYFYAMIWFAGKFTFEPFNMSPHYTAIIDRCIQIGFSAWLLIAVLQENAIPWEKDPRIWIASGIILYSTSTLFLFGLFDVMLVQSPDILRIIWHFNWYAIIITYGLFLRGLFCKPLLTFKDMVSKTEMNS